MMTHNTPHERIKKALRGLMEAPAFTLLGDKCGGLTWHDQRPQPTVTEINQWLTAQGLEPVE